MHGPLWDLPQLSSQTSQKVSKFANLLLSGFIPKTLLDLHQRETLQRYNGNFYQYYQKDGENVSCQQWQQWTTDRGLGKSKNVKAYKMVLESEGQR